MDEVTKALNRIEGQVRGIRKMYEEERDCELIVQQVAAARSALRRVAKVLLTSEALKCSKDPGVKKDLERIIDSLAKVG